MKTGLWIIISIVLIVALSGIGYFALPVLIEKETAGLRSDVQDVKQTLQKIEEESKAAPLKPDADFQKIIKTVNALYLGVNSAEDSFKKDMSVTNEAIKKQEKATEEAFKKQAEAIKNQKAATEEAFKKQAETIDKTNKETQSQIQRIKFDASMASIRGHILKARVEIAAKNVGTARTELDLIEELFKEAGNSASAEEKKVIQELQGILKKARAEMDTDLPAALNKIDLLWHETSKLLREG